MFLLLLSLLPPFFVSLLSTFLFMFLSLPSPHSVSQPIILLFVYISFFYFFIYCYFLYNFRHSCFLNCKYENMNAGFKTVRKTRDVLHVLNRAPRQKWVWRAEMQVHALLTSTPDACRSPAATARMSAGWNLVFSGYEAGLPPWSQ